MKTTLVGFLATIRLAAASCPFEGWPSHHLNVVHRPSFSLVNASHPDASQEENFYGFEGGAAVKIGDVYYLMLTEFYAAPRWVPSRLAVWRSSPGGPEAGPWTRLSTLFTSTGMVEENCTDPRGSLGSSVSPVYNEELGVWEVFYSAFYSCCPPDEPVHHFVNRYARQYHARSTVPGPEGIVGPYLNLGVVLAPEDADHQSWEGLQGIDSMSPPYIGTDGKWYAFYGSARTQNVEGHCSPTENNTNIFQQQGGAGQQVGLASSPKLEGPWKRLASGNPIALENPSTATEQPIVTRLSDGSYAAVFDALDHEGQGAVGYSWSPDGVRWHPECGQLLVAGGEWGKARTPQGIIEEGDGTFTLFFTGVDITGKMGPHESLGYATLAFDGETVV